MPKYYVEGCGLKKVFQADSRNDAAHIFMKIALKKAKGFSTIIQVSEMGFCEDIEELVKQDKNLRDDSTIALTCKILKDIGKEQLAFDCLRFLLEYMTKLPPKSVELKMLAYLLSGKEGYHGLETQFPEIFGKDIKDIEDPKDDSHE